MATSFKGVHSQAVSGLRRGVRARAGAGTRQGGQYGNVKRSAASLATLTPASGSYRTRSNLNDFFKKR